MIRSNATLSRRIIQQMQKRDDVLDFLALIKLVTVDDLIGYAGRPQAVFQGATTNWYDKRWQSLAVDGSLF